MFADDFIASHDILFEKNSSKVDTTHCDNAETVGRILRQLDSIRADKRVKFTRMEFVAASSPDGPTAYNRRLTEKRLHAAMDFVLRYVDVPDSLVTIKPIDTDWDMLRLLVERNDVPYKPEVLVVLDSVPAYGTDSHGRETTPRKDSLMAMHRGEVWDYMLRELFPYLRYSHVEICYMIPEEYLRPAEEPVAEEPAVTDAEPPTIVVEERQPVDEPVAEPRPVPAAYAATEVAERKPFYMSLSTNMLYDALLVPNIGAEFYLGKNWSISGDWMYGWWDTDRRHRYWRVYGGELAVRRWFGRAAEDKPLTGHHVGVYAQAITYDFEFGGKGQMAGEPGGSLWDRCSYGAGLEYGYSMAVAPRLNIDFTIGAGYFGGTYYKYRPMDGCYVWQSTHKRHWFGPTRAMVSLVWLLGHGNRNEKGGGR